MNPTASFDERAQSWDADPAKQQRAEAVADALRRRIPLSRSWQAFEYGCGTGLLSFSLHTDLGRITLADNSSGMLEVLERKIAASGLTHLHPLAVDLLTGPLPAERYELIYSLMTLHHVAGVGRLLRIFHELLRPGGWLAIADLDQEDGSFHGPGFAGQNGFDRGALRGQLTEAGFGGVDFCTAYVISKMTERGLREYPVFLAVATRPG